MSICCEQFNSNSSKFFKQQKSSRGRIRGLKNSGSSS
nr:MAG TPA: hypothetical protein [Caudoviricetes sp.]